MKKFAIAVLAACLVLSVGIAAQETSKAKSHSSSGAFDKGAEQAAGKIDINSASKDQLMTLNGIGDTTADKIIKGRPYKAKNDLVKNHILSRSAYDRIKEHIIAHQEQAASEK